MDTWAIMVPLVGLTIAALGVYMIWKVKDSKKTGIPLEDERTYKISGKAYKTGFLIGTFYLIALNFYNIISIEFLGGTQLESMLVINSALIIMGVTVIVMKTYFEGKEDV